MPITATVSADSDNAKRMSSTMNRTMNPDFVFVGNANMQHIPQYYVSIFNVSEVEHRIERPWVLNGVIVVPAKEPGERYSKPFKIADVVQIVEKDILSGEARSVGQSGKFLAQDAVNPEDMNGNWRTVRPVGVGRAQNEGTNLYHWGLFWTLNETPSEEELTTAVNRMEANYNRLIEEAKMLAITNNLLQIGNTHRRAASYFGRQFSWNEIYTKQIKCPGCGTMVDQDAAICPKCPATFKWATALQYGLRTVQQAIASGMTEAQAQALFAGQGEPAAERHGRKGKTAS